MLRNRSQFECKSCKWGRHCDESNPSKFPRWVIKNGGTTWVESNVCLLPMLDHESYELIKLYPHYVNKFLPTNDGLLNQSNFYLELMAFIDGYLNAEKNT